MDGVRWVGSDVLGVDVETEWSLQGAEVWSFLEGPADKDGFDHEPMKVGMSCCSSYTAMYEAMFC